ncbi:MAG: PaaI family thioesterase [Clostridiales Family XIII bacterium]|jgi:acyl-CoA thioesterase|nr:PaaI family thioesterase [Clostridiales Family XIII bacterium]
MDTEKIKNYFYNDKYLKLTGVSIDEVAADYAVCSFEIAAEKHLNAGNNVQGGAIFTLADSAFGVASNTVHIDAGEKKISVSQSASISYFKPPNGKKLIVTAKKISGGNKMSVYSMEVTDELGTKVALMIGNAYTVDL